MLSVKLFNTYSREKEEFKPAKQGRVLMYHCGPTVYWTQHIGNMRAMVMADIVVRTFKYLGYKVKLVRNYTDVGHLTSDADEGEDKMNKSAKAEHLEPKKIADKYIKIFEHDIHALNVPDADYKPRATETIKEMIGAIKILLAKGYAYTTDLAIYFDVSKAKNYSTLSHQKIEAQIKDAGKAEVSDPNKKNAADFAVWFFRAGKHKNAMQFWPSPFSSKLVEKGYGFPGWHLECSVMANKFLGPTIDVHMGGIEHISVHHTNEIAQSEAINAVKFVNYWLHNEHLLVNGGKMSKSEGTGYALSEVTEKGFNPVALRYFFLGAHYRSKQNFTWSALKGAATGLLRLYETVKNLKRDKGAKPDKNFHAKFIGYVSDDFNIPQALRTALDVLKSDLSQEIKYATLTDFDQVLGLGIENAYREKAYIPARIKKLAANRWQAKKNNDWTKADELRKKIEMDGFIILDNKNDFEIKKIPHK